VTVTRGLRDHERAAAAFAAVHARTCVGAGKTAMRSDASGASTWWSELHRADTDDDLLRFFTVYKTAGMLG
jgi:hypothetical protein